MVNVKQNITFQAKAKLGKVISDHFLYQAGIALGQTIIDLIKIRTDAGFDKYGKKFKPLSASYKKLKQRVISGKSTRKLKSGKTKVNRTVERLIKQKRAGMAARSITDYMHLTGQLWTDLRFDMKAPKKSLFGTIKIPIQFYVGQKSIKKASGLKEMGRDMFGLAVAGAFKDKERGLLKETMMELFKNKIANVNVRVS